MATENTRSYYFDLAKYHMYIGAVHLGVAFYNFAMSERTFNDEDTNDWFEASNINRKFYSNLEFGEFK